MHDFSHSFSKYLQFAPHFYYAPVSVGHCSLDLPSNVIAEMLYIFKVTASELVKNIDQLELVDRLPSWLGG
jgi:hypothetical protein